MRRSSQHQALVLYVRASAEANREANFLCADRGLVRATVYGGPKSKLRAHVAPYHRGTLWLYHDPVRDYYKVTDFDVSAWRPELRERLERSLDAAVLAETVLLCRASGGDWQTALDLADEGLETIAAAEANKVRPALLRFLWKWIRLLGLSPDPQSCSECGSGLHDAGKMCYVLNDGRLACASCATGTTGQATRLIAKGTLRWLDSIGCLDGPAAERVSLDRDGYRQAEYLLRTIIEAAAGSRLKSLDW